MKIKPTTIHSSLPTVALIGRANVGKSTLFNKLAEGGRALVSPIEGTTRDANVGTVEWQRQAFKLIDTGGILDTGLLSRRKRAGSNISEIDRAVIFRSRDQLDSADLLVFVVDVIDGLMPQDEELAKILKKLDPDWDKRIILAINKADSRAKSQRSHEFSRLNFGEPFIISAATGSGTGDLLDEITSRLAKAEKEKAAESETDARPINLLIAGKPNVGKSSLLNALTGESKAIVSPIPHTTREPQDALITYKDRVFRLIDTAGISRSLLKESKKQVREDSLEIGGIRLSLKALDEADIVMLAFDITQEITHQEAKLVEEIFKRNKSIILIANKWDLVADKNVKKSTQYIHSILPFATWAPIEFISAKTGRRVTAVLETAAKVADSRRIWVGDDELKEFLSFITRKQKPLKSGGFKRPFIFSIKQAKSDPPQFEVMVGPRDKLHDNYVRFIENQLRSKFNFLGTPLSIFIAHKHGKHGEKK